MWPSMPVMVSAATRALTIASSVASTVASKNGVRSLLGSHASGVTPVSAAAPGFAVENATKMSPEPFELVRQQRGVGRDHHDDRPVAVGGRPWRCVLAALGADDLASHRHAGDGELLARAVVGLHEHAHGVAARGAARRADAALEAVRHHAGAAADVAFGHRAAPRARQRLEHVRLRHVLSLAVVEEGIRRLADHRLVPRDGRPQHLVEVAVDGIAHRADRIGAGDHHRAAQDAALDHPRRAGHLAEAVAREPAGEHRRPAFAARPHGGDAGAHGTTAHHQWAVATHDRRVTHFDAGDVGDGVQGPGRAVERDAEHASPRPRLRERVRRGAERADHGHDQEGGGTARVRHRRQRSPLSRRTPGRRSDPSRRRTAR